MPRKAVADKPPVPRVPRHWNISYRLVPASEVHTPFAAKGRPDSPYRSAICELLKPTAADKVLEFPDAKVRYQLVKHARILDVRLLFAEEGGKLFVQLSKAPKINEDILAFIRERPRTKAEIESMIFTRKLELNLAAELRALSEAGFVLLDGDSRWHATKSSTNGGSRPK
jgi:hypothetical protein